jgi:hypothetical protein
MRDDMTESMDPMFEGMQRRKDPSSPLGFGPDGKMAGEQAHGTKLEM